MFVLASIGTHAIGYSMHSKPPTIRRTISSRSRFVADAPLMLMTQEDLPANSLKEFMAYTKANQDKLPFSSGGTGTSSHVSCVMLNQIMGVDVTHVPYRGGGPAFAGRDRRPHRLHLQLHFDRGAAVKAGQVKALATLARDARRFSPICRRPTSRAEGLRRLGLERDPAAEKRDAGDGGEAQRRREQGARQPGVPQPARRYRADRGAPDRRSPEYLRTYIESEIKKWAAPVKASGLQVD